MKSVGLGSVLGDLKKTIQQIHMEIEELGQPSPQMHELIESTNLLRSNEHLNKTNEKKTQLIEAYSLYTNQIENLLFSVFEIQNELKDLIKDQTELMSKTSRRPKTSRKIQKRTRKKITKKPKKKTKPRKNSKREL